MAASPLLSPVVATPLAHRKRRHSVMNHEVIDLTGDDDDMPPRKARASSVPELASANGDSTQRRLEDEDDSEEDDKSLIEDLLDTAELEPYVHDEMVGENGLRPEKPSELRSHLLRVGVEQFWEDALGVQEIPAGLLGTAFGIDPSYEDRLGEDTFLRILGNAIVRFYHKRQKLSQYNTIDDVAELLKSSNKIMVITGAGISTSLGIPDFRSKGTGFYDKVIEAGYSEGEEVFDIHEFDHDPSKFYGFIHNLLPDVKTYSPAHGFVRLLQDKGKLQTNYTQNIDNIEQMVGIESGRLVQAHGSFASATCRKNREHKVEGTDIFPSMREGSVAYCKRCEDEIAAQNAAPKKKQKVNGHKWHDNDDDDDSEDDKMPTRGVMKPDITFFGEQLPNDFFDRFTEQDSKTVDLVIVIGTSLKVAPVSEMPNYLPHHVPHIYISREPIQRINFDVQLLGECDYVVFELCRRAGWELKHSMIPDGLEVQVEAMDEREHVWQVRPKRYSVEGTSLRDSVSIANVDA